MSGTTLLRVDNFTPMESGGETYVASLLGGEYIARYKRISGIAGRVLTTYMWSTRQSYDRGLHGMCIQQARRFGAIDYTIRAEIASSPSQTHYYDDLQLSNALCSMSNVRSVVHGLTAHTIMWQHADLPPDDSYGQRSLGADAETNEMLVQIYSVEGRASSVPESFIKHTGSFAVRRSLDEALEAFTDLDGILPTPPRTPSIG